MPTKTLTKAIATPSDSNSSGSNLDSNVPEQGYTSSLSPAALGLMADFFKVLSEVSRLQIVCSLKSGAKSVTEIIEATALGQANVSKHLKMLTQAGVVSREQRGVSVYYQIANPFLFELCDLVYDALSVQVRQQNQHLEGLSSFRQSRQ